jgi:hypothetical protein
MKKATMAVITAGCVALLATPVLAVQTDSCGWEDGTSTVLGTYGNIGTAENVGAPDPVNSGVRSLKLVEDPIGGTPQAFVFFVEGLTDGDVIDACFWGYDTTPAASPSARIWAHYATSGDIDSYNGSAGGNDTYTDGTGWSQLCHSWVFDSSLGTRDALIVEVRLYSGAIGEDTIWVDDATITVSSDTATISTPCTGAVSVDQSSWGEVKASYR